MTGSDAEDFTAFVEAVGWRIQRAAFLLTGDRHLAEDLTQATLTKVFSAWRRVKGDPFAYAYRTLSNTYISHRRLRRNSEHPVDWTEDRADEAAVQAADPTTRVDVVVALGALTPLDRGIVVLRYLEDLSVADTASYLGLSENVVRVRSHRALRKLRSFLDSTVRAGS